MDELIVKELRGQATDIETRQLRSWRSASEENERKYREVVRFWRRIETLPPVEVGPAPALETVIGEGDARRRRRAVRSARRAALRSPWAGYGLAAAAVAALLLIVARPDRGVPPTVAGLSPVESSSGVGDVTTMSLSDGSVVRVAPGTRIEFPNAAPTREVIVEGKAFFAVAEDPLPFVVRTRMGVATVRGTRFEVMTVGDELRLTVVEGVVGLEGEGGSAEVGRGQVAFLSLGSSPRVADHDDVWSLLDWAGGLLVFQATPLGEVARELARHFGRDVTVEGERLQRLRITAWFQDEGLEDVVSAVCLVAGTPCTVDDSVVTIGR